jgi:hypothetical protein
MSMEGGGGRAGVFGSDCYELNGSAFEPRCGQDIFLFLTFVQKCPGDPPGLASSTIDTATLSL